MLTEEMLQEQHEQDLQRLRGFRLFDDDFMTRCFDGDTESIQLILSIILGRNDIEIISVKTQYNIKNLVRRSVRLDVYARDNSGKVYNIEIQRDDRGAGFKRARYNSSLIDANVLPTGDDPNNLPETYVIFLTENDTFSEGLPLYHIDRTCIETGKPIEDEAHIVYVNGTYVGDSEIGKLIHDFKCTDADDMYYAVLAKKVRFYKEDEKGVAIMCKAMEEMRNETNRETKKGIAVELIKEGTLSLDKIAAVCNLTVEEVKELTMQPA